MADIVFNIAKGRINELVRRVATNDPASSALVAVALQAVESDALLQDRDTLDAILGAAANTEADFTNYARIVLTDADLSAPSPDDSNDRQEADMPDLVWSGAGGPQNNDLVKIVLCYDADTGAGDDTNLVPLCAFDFVQSTNGGDITATVPATGFHRAT